MMKAIVTKSILALGSLVLFMAVLPAIAIRCSLGWGVTGLWMLVFLFLNPILILFLSILAGSDLTHLWWIPPTSAALFPLLFAIAIGEVVWDLYVYSAIYLTLGTITMLLTHGIRLIRSKWKYTKTQKEVKQ